MRAGIQLCLAVQVYTDSHVSTKFYWARPHMLSPESTATITWDIPEGTPAGAAPHQYPLDRSLVLNLHPMQSNTINRCKQTVKHAVQCARHLSAAAKNQVVRTGLLHCDDWFLSGVSPWDFEVTVLLS